MPQRVLIGDLPTVPNASTALRIPAGRWRLVACDPDFGLGLVCLTLDAVGDITPPADADAV